MNISTINHESIANVIGFNQLNTNSQSVFTELLAIANQLNFLPDKPDETPTTTLITLWHFAQDLPLSCQTAAAKPLFDLNNEQEKILRSLLTQRVDGTPLSYIVGRQGFMGLELLASPDAVIPRLETQMLANFCLRQISQTIDQCGTALIIDQFTGSGNLPLCFAKYYPAAKVFGGDIAEKTIALAQRNAEHCNLTQVEFRISDMFAAFDNDDFLGKTDLISGAPPYISSKKVPEMQKEISQFEPELAFEAGPFGVKFFVRLINESPRFLRTGGWLAFEVGLGQGPAMLKLLERSKDFNQVETVCDDEGSIRVVAGRKI